MSRRAGVLAAAALAAVAVWAVVAALAVGSRDGPPPRRPAPPYPYAEVIERAAREFGLDYAEVIERAAREFGLDPALVAAVIDNESGFAPRKRSPDGARGLMQVMPDTAALAARDLGLRPLDPDDLYDPELNVRLGCWYLARLLRQYDGDLVAALAAYNAGPGTVEAWRRLPRWWQGRGVERIPVMETRSYVLLVLREYRRYRGGG